MEALWEASREEVQHRDNVGIVERFVAGLGVARSWSRGVASALTPSMSPGTVILEHAGPLAHGNVDDLAASQP